MFLSETFQNSLTTLATMRALLYWSVYFLFPYFITCADIDSYEVNRLEITPMYDIILFNDIADVINNMESEVNSQADAFTESDSKENVEDLLLEYQHYLDKAHKQRLDYLDKVSGKNKVPLLRHDKYPKKKPVPKNNVGDFYKPNSNNIQPSSRLFPNLHSFMPKYSSQYSYGTLSSHAQNYKPISPFNIDYTENKNENYGMSYDIQKPVTNQHLLSSSCYCKTNEIPCRCGCKQCIVTIDSVPKKGDPMQSRYDSSNLYMDPPYENHMSNDLINKEKENDLKLRIKIDIKLPKIFETFAKLYDNRSQNSKVELDTILTSDSARNYVSPYLKHSDSTDLLRYNPISELANSFPVQRITIHKKKKTRSNSNKKHRKKPLFMHDVSVNKNLTIDVSNHTKPLSLVKSIILNNNDSSLQKINSSKSELKIENAHSKEFIYVTLNISNNRYNENHTDDIVGIENSIETGELKTKENKTALGINIRDKRQANLTNVTLVIPIENKFTDIVNETRDYKFEKILNDPNLLYWPENKKPQINNNSKNINAIIINVEKGKTKFNMSKENMRINHSMALEKAIFGDVDWNDIDTITPMFISFVGKYVKGALTFCSNTICHSMKCAEKSCIHRKCEPANRYSKIGHCLGTNNTDSIAKMENVMDLPSNVAFEIVDILKDKLDARMFGKMTICIGLKCITFAASKKTILKSKCTLKELTPKKECPFIRRY